MTPHLIQDSRQRTTIHETINKEDVFSPPPPPRPGTSPNIVTIIFFLSPGSYNGCRSSHSPKTHRTLKGMV